MSKSTGFTIPSLDGIRAAAILLVFAGHAGLPIPVNGSSGVTAFFFLSGYLITTLLRREQEGTGRVSVGAFYLRRTLRIFPPMYAALLLAVLLAVTGVIADDLSGPAQAATALHLTNYWIIVEGRDGLVSTIYALWSLAVEEHFYLVFPVLFIGLSRLSSSRRLQAAVLTTICIGMLGWRLLLSSEGATFDRLYLATDTRADGILWGCVLALVANPCMDRIPGSRRLWSYGALPLGLVLFWYGQHLPGQLALTVGFTVQAVALALMLTAVVRFPTCWAGKILNWKPIAVLGVLSYSFYLLHRIPLVGLEEWTRLDRWSVAAGGFAITVIGSLVFYWGIEKPSVRLRRRLTRVSPPAPTPAREGLLT
jgi:peptidoglycan/LPS O-acetylase OafA/YrhL